VPSPAETIREELDALKCFILLHVLDDDMATLQREHPEWQISTVWASAASGPAADGAHPYTTQNSHHVGPEIRPMPPTRNATIMVPTATQDTGRP
jgi:hypothetical protein